MLGKRLFLPKIGGASTSFKKRRLETPENERR